MMYRFLVGFLVAYSSIAFCEDSNVYYLRSVNNDFSATGVTLQTSKGVVLLTNAHVCKTEKVLLAVNSNKSSIVIVKQIYKLADLCLLTPPNKSVGYVLADGYEFNESVYIHGYPNDVYTETSGVIIFKYKVDEVGEIMLGSTAKVDFGSSGSPVMNNGKVLGLVSEKTTTGESRFVPIEFIRDFLNQN